MPHQHATHSKTVLVHAQFNHQLVLRTLRPGVRIVLGNGGGASGLTIAVIAGKAQRFNGLCVADRFDVEAHPAVSIFQPAGLESGWELESTGGG
ncbi:MAG: hypothetical protein ACLQM8_17730 [Limisphaerales bacterium]